MPNILFASNSISHFPGSEVLNPEWAYDASRVPYAIWTPPQTICSSPIFEPSTSDETWFHCRAGFSNLDINELGQIFRVTDEDGNTMFNATYENRDSDGWRFQFFAGAQSDIAPAIFFPMRLEQMRTYDIQLKYTNLVAECRFYMNEILVYEKSFAITEKEYPRHFLIGGLNGYSSGGYFSEILVADGDTRNARLDLLRPTAAGAYGNWDGPLSSLSDDDPTTGMTTTLPDQTQSTLMTPYTGANNISNVVQVTTTVRGINSPEELQHLIRMSAVDYLTSNFVVPFEKDFQVTDWTQNPATSVPWAASDLNAIEFGFRSKAAV